MSGMMEDACALAIGGLDPGGGAGLAADLRAFARAGACGCAAIAVVTVQSTSGLRTSRPLDAREVLVKGGHLRGPRAVDVLAMHETTYELDAPRLRLPPTHGGGCVLASLIAGRIARHPDFTSSPARALLRAVRWAKRVHAAALVDAR